MLFTVGQKVVVAKMIDVSQGKREMWLKKGTPLTVKKYYSTSLVCVKAAGLAEEIMVYEHELEAAK
jgi:hypothetical protein